MLVDSHCHLDFDTFDDDRADTIQRARSAGVEACVTICTHLSRFDGVRAIAHEYKNIYCSVGIHPHQVAEEEPVEAQTLVRVANSEQKVVGIGETGLDFFYTHSPPDAQRDSFRVHIAAARETGLPLIVHARDADGDVADILEEEYRAGAFPGVLHCFSSGRKLAERALDLGFFISFSGIVTFKNAGDLREIARDVPRDRILVETDSPFLAPIPNRGKRNEPAFVVHTAEAVAKVLDMEADAFADLTTENFYRLFTRTKRPEAS